MSYIPRKVSRKVLCKVSRKVLCKILCKVSRKVLCKVLCKVLSKVSRDIFRGGFSNTIWVLESLKIFCV